MADYKKIRDRAFAMSGAILFFVTSIALSVIVIVQVVQEKNAKKEAEKSAASQTASQDTPPVSPPDGTKLEGTKLEGFEPVESVKEIQTTDLTVGSGKEVKSVKDTVTADYTGALAATGVIFQSSIDSGKPFTTTLDGVIKGWQKGVIGMKEGGKRRLLIPSAEAYGSNAQSGIPANSDLVFDITLHSVGK